MITKEKMALLIDIANMWDKAGLNKEATDMDAMIKAEAADMPVMAPNLSGLTDRQKIHTVIRTNEVAYEFLAKFGRSIQSLADDGGDLLEMMDLILEDPKFYNQSQEVQAAVSQLKATRNSIATSLSRIWNMFR